MLRLGNNSKEVFKRAWSVRLMLLAAFLNGLDVSLAIIGPWLPIPVGVFAAISFIVGMGALYARFVVQSNLPGDC